MRKAVIACILTVLALGQITAQNRLADSLLRAVMMAKEDTIILRARLEMGNYFLSTASYDEALQHINSAEQLARKINHKLFLASALNLKGIIANSQGNYPQALRYNLEALQIYEQQGTKFNLCAVSINIGNVYLLQANYSKALPHFYSALQLARELKNKEQMAACLSNIGSIYYEQGNNTEALLNYKASLELSEEMRSAHGIAIACNNIGNIYSKQKKFEDALKYGSRSLRISVRFQDRHGQAIAGGAIGEIYLAQKKYREAAKYLNESLQLCLEIGDKEGAKFSYNSLSRLDSLKGDFKNAYKNYFSYIRFRDSITNEDNTKKSIQAQLQYNFDKKALADSVKNATLVEEEELRFTHDIEQQRLYTWGGILAFVLMMGVAIMVFRAYRHNHKAIELISRQKQIVETKQQAILDSLGYARRIQKALLPTEVFIDRVLEKLNGNGKT